MGVVTAVPTSEYEIMSVDITKIGETKKGPKRGPKPTTTERALGENKKNYLNIISNGLLLLVCVVTFMRL